MAREASQGAISGGDPLGPGLRGIGEDDSMSVQEHLTYLLDSTLNEEVGCDDCGQPDPSNCPVTEASQKDIVGFVRSTLQRQVSNLMREVKTAIFLAFPCDSLFQDPGVEELYQRYHTQQWCLRVDWSIVAFLQILAWDLTANPPYRFTLVIYFNCAFLAMVLIHKVLFLAFGGCLQIWKVSRSALLCCFLLGRGAVCHPVFGAALPDDPVASSAQSVQAASSLIGLGMTNLSAVLALQLHTLDTLLLCITQGLACVCWTYVAIDILSDDAWNMLIVGHSLVAVVCVWQQHHQEKLDRSSFEQKLVMQRSLLLQSADRMVRQCTKADFNKSTVLLYRVRCVEELNLQLRARSLQSQCCTDNPTRS